jgi:hypothetical protein
MGACWTQPIVPGERGSTLPLRAGIGLKPQHADEILSLGPDLGFLEVHAENYLGGGGRPHRMLGLVRAAFPLSIHGVGLSIGGEGPLDAVHLSRIAELVDHYQPDSFSEHLAWSSHGENYWNDLLPVRYDAATLRRVCDHVDEVQARLRRTILLENPSTYVEFTNSFYDEVDFIDEVSRRTGCGLLLDINNVEVSCTNHGRDPLAYLDRFPLNRVGEIHLGGHDIDVGPDGTRLLIDSHACATSDGVWGLYEAVIGRTGPLPTLIEWDNDVPSLDVLLSEAAQAERRLRANAGRYTVSQ